MTKIIAFCCQYCAYAAADLAGSMKLQYPVNINIIRLPCSGKIDELYLLRAFENGADGVFVAGCEEGNCHFLKGNLWAKKRVTRAKQLLAEVGLEKERLEMFNLSASQGRKFVQIAREFTDRINRLGITPIKAKAS
jgi:coenzyme F420-reducing hydrogenase delta subunit